MSVSPQAIGAWIAHVKRTRDIDAATAQAVASLRPVGIECLLLKGPAVARWLYSPEGQRTYGDSDLLVRRDSLDGAGAVLRMLGYAPQPHADTRHDPMRALDSHEQVWEREEDGRVIELHWTLIGLEGPPADVWSALTHDTEVLIVAGCDVRVASPAARAMCLALHVAQHGVVWGQPLEDLRRGIAQLDFATWSQARDLAARLRGLDAFGAGLRACPSGARLADELALARPSTYWTLRAQAPQRGATRLSFLRDAHGLRERWAIVREGARHCREYVAESTRNEGGQARAAARVPAALRALWLAWRSDRRAARRR